MNEEIIENLKCLSLTSNEIKVYLTLTRTGVSTAYNIAKKSGVFKANTYEIMKKLLKKGLINEKTISDKVYYESNDPKFLLEIVKGMKEDVESIIPKLRLIQKESDEDSSSNIYNGTSSFITLLYQFLDFNEPIYVYGAPKYAYEIMKYQLKEYHNIRIRSKIKMYHIYNFEAVDRVKKLRKLKYTYARTLPELYDSEVSTNICGDLVVFVVWKPPIKIIKIKEKMMSDAYKKYFNILWKNAKSD